MKELHDIKDKCMKIEEYEEVREEYRKLREERQTYWKYLKKLHLERDKVVRDEKDILNSYAKCSRELKEYYLKKKKLMNKLKHNTDVIRSFEEKVQNQKIEYENKLMEKQHQKNRLYDINKKIEVLELKLVEEKNKHTNYEKDVHSDSQAFVQLESEINKVNQRFVKASVEKNGLEHAANELRSQLNSLQDEDIKKMKILEQCDKPTYEGACWLKENKNYFKCNVYLPIMYEIKMISNEYSKYVESVIAFKDMIAFVCENKSDCEQLTQILKYRMKLAVNIVVAPETPLSKYVSPPLTPEYRQFGLECFVKDLFTAPEAVMKYLCQCFHIHRIPVSKSTISSNNIDLILPKFETFFFENVKISSKCSIYGDKNLSIKRQFIMDKAHHFLVDHNEELQKSVEQKFKEMKERIGSKEKEIEEYKNDIAKREIRKSIFLHKKKLLQEQWRRTRELESELLQKVKYQSLISVVIDEEVEKEKITKIIQSANENKTTALCKRNSLLMDFIQIEKEIVKVILKMNFLSKSLKTTKSGQQDLYDRVKAAEIEFQNIKDQFSEKKRYGLMLSDEIRTFKMSYHQLLPVDDIDERLFSIQAELNFSDDNKHVVTEYGTRKKAIDELEHQIDSFKAHIHKIKEVIEIKKKEWLKPVQCHIGNINKKFSHFFKKMNCAGEISLDVPDNSDDFTRYGLQIQLKFRDADTFSELTCGQSGGESTLAVVLLILSLQGFRKVPFRCIDEFSQHMDPNNKRKIYQFIFDNRIDMHSQYFLLTPELLLNLKYPDDVTFHIIFNSSFLESALDVKKNLDFREQCNTFCSKH